MYNYNVKLSKACTYYYFPIEKKICKFAIFINEKVECLRNKHPLYIWGYNLQINFFFRKILFRTYLYRF